MLGIGSRSVVCKASPLPAVLSLQPQPLLISKAEKLQWINSIPTHGLLCKTPQTLTEQMVLRFR